jgi:purine-binding chemotaxis protein CheW
MNSSPAETPGIAARSQWETQLVVFVLADLELALPIHEVREIIRVNEITFMPKAPKFLEGIINLRGRVIPVLDLKKRFEMPLVDRTEESRILVVEWKDQLLSLLVDRVLGVLKIPSISIEPVQEPFLTIGEEFLNGKALLGDRCLALFNLEKVFSFEEVRALPAWEGA